jgi:hypothetical protein
MLNVIVDDSESDRTFQEATVVAVRIVPMESVQKANINIDVEAKGEATVSIPETWTPNKNEWLIMISLAFISLMVALDSSILVTVLPVSPSNIHIRQKGTDFVVGNSAQAQWYLSTGILGWYILSAHLSHLPASHRVHQSDLWSAATARLISRLLYSWHDTLLGIKGLHNAVGRPKHTRRRRWRHNLSHTSHLLRHCTAQTATEILPSSVGLVVHWIDSWPTHRRRLDRESASPVLEHIVSSY